MLAMASEEHPIARQTGRRRPVTAQWISAATAAFNALPRTKQTTKKAIAEKCGTSGPYLSQLLDGKYETSTFLDCLSAVLGIDVPPVVVETAEMQEVVDRMADYDQDMMQALHAVMNSIEQLRKK